LWKLGSGFTEISAEGSEVMLVKGLPWLDNHWVNFLSNAITMLGAGVLYGVLGV